MQPNKQSSEARWLDSGLLLIDDVLDEALCNALINQFERDPQKEPGRTEVGVVEGKRSMDLAPDASGSWSEPLSLLDAAIERSVALVISEPRSFLGRIAAVVPLTITKPQFQKYRRLTDDGFDWHIDSIPPDTRVLAGIAYLNDVAIGGETEFRQGFDVKPGRGRVILFSPYWTHIHRGVPAISHHKYVVTWFIQAVG